MMLVTKGGSGLGVFHLKTQFIPSHTGRGKGSNTRNVKFFTAGVNPKHLAIFL